MRRWNGWGFEWVDYEIKDPALLLIREKMGKGYASPSKSLKELLNELPPPKIKSFPYATDCQFQRLIHSYGQSFPDWLKFKMGYNLKAPDLVAFPENEDQIEEILQKAKKERCILIPYGGGTSVLRHLEPPEVNTPVITVDLKNLNRFLGLDEKSLLATFEAGITGPELEKILNYQGYTCRHFPQSFELSTLGGWIATRSSGQFSLGYGKIERIFQGGTVISPEGTINLSPYPASASGIELKHMVLGSEGRIGFITKAIIKVSRIPEKEVVEASVLPSDEVGFELVRHLAQERIPLTMIRLSFAKETKSILSLSAHHWWYNLLEKYLNFRKIPKEKCLLLFAASGSPKQVRLSASHVKSMVRKFKGVNLGSIPGKRWLKERFKLPYLRNNLWDMGYGVDTLETATWWSNVINLKDTIEEILERNGAYAFSHLSHVYPTGSSIYTTFIFPLNPSPEVNWHKWKKMKEEVSKAIIQNGGTISHHHGVGIDHSFYMPEEKGALGIKAIKDIIKSLDPYNIMNPGKMAK
ncbi:alkyldihydroxyacetonephosphate synthase [Thermosulfidibacter takaii ABI70S6]|uniref:Alkyldihydroxyacetonephosphate synthase n=1 Tax=Thermosulfidibacter takaii (strain DSM 17441 / JCM 13301 / NBRC 103674 / ABI70S6) TaxID=1298851 RepID=A0A0S3QS59_THET7|nr:FAD-binding oxidoreductase [Thermosulfidibacter takaii]BAT71166.1 alkyldihydroxyacetonephosphate synthase [Thermosulfidibacter takaii ABI70S6]